MGKGEIASPNSTGRLLPLRVESAGSAEERLRPLTSAELTSSAPSDFVADVPKPEVRMFSFHASDTRFIAERASGQIAGKY
jgi:hypothetical protein